MNSEFFSNAFYVVIVMIVFHLFFSAFIWSVTLTNFQILHQQYYCITSSVIYGKQMFESHAILYLSIILIMISHYIDIKHVQEISLKIYNLFNFIHTKSFYMEIIILILP